MGRQPPREIVSATDLTQQQHVADAAEDGAHQRRQTVDEKAEPAIQTHQTEALCFDKTNVVRSALVHIIERKVEAPYHIFHRRHEIG